MTALGTLLQEDIQAENKQEYVVHPLQCMGFPGGSVVKNLPANAGDVGDKGWIPGSGRSPGGGRGNAFQYSCLENSMDRGA